APRTASASCATPSPASPPCSPRPTSTWPSAPSIARSRAFPASIRPKSGSPSPPPSTSGSADMRSIDLATTPLRDLNASLHELKDGTNETEWEVLNPRGQHAVAAGVDAPVNIDIRGPVGYYCAGMNKQATITVHGSSGPGTAENMMSGRV